jgi:hypothetical protein
MRLGSYDAEGAQARACGLADDSLLVGLSRAAADLPADLLTIVARAAPGS